MSNTTLARVLVLCGVALLVAPALSPVQPVLYHDTRGGTVEDRPELESQGYEVVAYENLSARGQELYVRTLQERGEYRVPLETGAPEFPYPTPGELRDARNHRQRTRLGSIVVERPPDADLPPADEPLHAAEHLQERDEERGRDRDREGGTGSDEERATPGDRGTSTDDDRSVEEWRQQIARYDVLETRTGRPPLDAPTSLLRLLSAVAGVLALAIGGYRSAQP